MRSRARPNGAGFADDPKKSKEENAKAIAAAQKVVDTEGITIFKSDGKTACDAKDTYKDADCTVLKLKFAYPDGLRGQGAGGQAQAGPVLPHRHESVGHLSGQGREYHRR